MRAKPEVCDRPLEASGGFAVAVCLPGVPVRGPGHTGGGVWAPPAQRSQSAGAKRGAQRPGFASSALPGTAGQPGVLCDRAPAGNVLILIIINNNSSPAPRAEAPGEGGSRLGKNQSEGNQGKQRLAEASNQFESSKQCELCPSTLRTQSLTRLSAIGDWRFRSRLVAPRRTFGSRRQLRFQL